MTFTEEQRALLAGPLSKANVKKNPRGFDYVEAWHAIAEANRIFGFDAWTRETVLLQETNRELIELKGQSGPYKQWRVGYLAKVRIRVGEIVREGTGFGSGMAKPEAIGDAIESAAKEAESDAMKRALMTFGNPFGLALYDKAQTNVSDGREPPPPGPVEDLAANYSDGRKTPAQAKRDGDNEKIKADIAKCDKAGLLDWHTHFDEYTAHLPVKWLDSVRDMLEHRLEELNGAANIANAEAELDAGFRGAVGSAAHSGVSGRNGQVAA